MKVITVSINGTARRLSGSTSIAALIEEMGLTGKRIAMDLKVGDRVIYAKYGGAEIKIDDQELVIMRESDILAKKS